MKNLYHILLPMLLITSLSINAITELIIEDSLGPASVVVDRGVVDRGVVDLASLTQEAKLINSSVGVEAHIPLPTTTRSLDRLITSGKYSLFPTADIMVLCKFADAFRAVGLYSLAQLTEDTAKTLNDSSIYLSVKVVALSMLLYELGKAFIHLPRVKQELVSEAYMTLAGLSILSSFLFTRLKKPLNY